MLTASDRLPNSPRRVVIAGVSGSGKSTLGHAIASALGSQYVEIDALFHGPKWTVRPTFMAEVEAFTSEDSWVTDWQYAEARPLLTARADLFIWLDLPFALTLTRVTRRTVRRAVTRETLWNGNVELPLHKFFSDPEHVIRWSISTRHELREAVPTALMKRPELTAVRLSSRTDVESWVQQVARWRA